MQQGGNVFFASRKSEKWEADIDIGYSLRIGWKAEIPRSSPLRAYVCWSKAVRSKCQNMLSDGKDVTPCYTEGHAASTIISRVLIRCCSIIINSIRDVAVAAVVS